MVTRLYRSLLGSYLVASAAFTSLSEAAAPKSTSAKLTKVFVEAEGGQQFGCLQVIIDFDQDLYLKDAGGTLTSVADIHGNVKSNGRTISKSIIEGLGSVKLTCPNGVVLNADDTFSSDGPPPKGYLYFGTPSHEPVSSFIMSMSGIALNETYFKNRISLINVAAYPGEGFSISDDDYKNCVVSFSTSVTNPEHSIVVNSAGETVSGDVSFDRVEPPTCDYQKFQEFRKVWKNLMDTALDLTSKSAVNNMDTKFMAVLARTGFSDCFEKLKTFFVIGKGDLTLDGFKDCPHRWNETDPDWLADPCCNWRLEETVCCAAKTVTIQVPKLDDTKSDVINGACASPGKIGPVLLDYVDVQRKQSLVAEEDFGKVWEKLTRFNSDCQQKVFDTSCTDDTQCPYTGECDSNRGKCHVPYDAMAAALTKCYVREMDEDLKSEFKVYLSLQAKYVSTEAEEKAFFDKLWEKATTFDCEGPDSQSFRSKREWSVDDNGEWSETVIAGNQTGCVHKKLCNFYSAWEVFTKPNPETCPGSAPTNICMDCRGDFCNPVTEQPKCTTYNLDSTQCAAASGTYEFGSCKLPHTTKETCLTNAYCRNATNFQNECGPKSCIVTTVSSKAACKKWREDEQAAGRWTWSWWNKAQNACQIWKDKTSCEADGHQFWEGRHFKPGKYDTEAKCNQGLCTHPELRWREIQPSKDECEKSQFCTTPCRGCESKGSYSSVCVNTTITTSSACSTASGKWVAAVGDAAALCMMENYNWDKDECVASGYAYYTCGDQTSRGTCGDSPAESALTCYWSSHARCTDKAHCESSGYCTDWDLANACEWNQCSKTGVCIKPFDADRNCDWASGESWSQSGCVLSSMDETTCATNNYSWKERATNKADCTGSVTMCKDPSRGGWHSLKNSTECSKCEGKMDGVYDWVEPKWKNASVSNLTWTAVEAKPVNRWIRTLDYGKFHSMVDGVISQIIARKKYNSFAAKYNPLMVLLNRVACDCGVGGSDCFANVEAVELEKCRVDPGAESTCGGLNINTTSSGSGTDHSFTLTVDEVPASQLAGGDATAKRSLQFSKASSSDYEVVKKLGHVVGQLVGNGKGYSCSGGCNGASVEVCFDKNVNIPQNTDKYTILDIAKDKSGSVGEPMEISVTSKNGGMQYCADLSTAGTYYPILRVADSSLPTSPKPSPSPGPSNPNSAATPMPSSWAPLLTIAIAFWTMVMA